MSFWLLDFRYHQKKKISVLGKKKKGRGPRAPNEFFNQTAGVHLGYNGGGGGRSYFCKEPCVDAGESRETPRGGGREGGIFPGLLRKGGGGSTCRPRRRAGVEKKKKKKNRGQERLRLTGAAENCFIKVCENGPQKREETSKFGGGSRKREENRGRVGARPKWPAQASMGVGTRREGKDGGEDGRGERKESRSAP